MVFLCISEPWKKTSLKITEMGKGNANGYWFVLRCGNVSGWLQAHGAFTAHSRWPALSWSLKALSPLVLEDGELLGHIYSQGIWGYVIFFWYVLVTSQLKLAHSAWQCMNPIFPIRSLKQPSENVLSPRPTRLCSAFELLSRSLSLVSNMFILRVICSLNEMRMFAFVTVLLAGVGFVDLLSF